MVAGNRFCLATLLVAVLVLGASHAAAAPHGSFSVSISAALITRQSGRREARGMLSISVPLDRFLAPPVVPAPRGRTRALAQGGSAPDADTTSGGDTASDHGVSDPPTIMLGPALARAAVRAALRAHGYPAARRRLSSMASRARLSATLPEVRLRAARTNDESLRLTPTSSDPYRYSQSGGSTLWFEARLTWKLDCLVFADEELAVERLRQRRDKARVALVEHVLSALFAWQRALVKAADTSLLPNERTLAELDALEAEATLDVLTGGWFSKRRHPGK